MLEGASEHATHTHGVSGWLRKRLGGKSESAADISVRMIRDVDRVFLIKAPNPTQYSVRVNPHTQVGGSYWSCTGFKV